MEKNFARRSGLSSEKELSVCVLNIDNEIEFGNLVHHPSGDRLEVSSNGTEE
jgi:hypothetical protein